MEIVPVSPVLSVLDLAVVGPGELASDALAATVTLARAAEAGGFARVWYAEHHNVGLIASSAPALLIAHVAAHTRHIRLGAGGVMLPNHAPLTVAEQFGTLSVLHPGRVDLGLGRAPGGDPASIRALRRDPRAADTFEQDVEELQGFLIGRSQVPGVQAVPVPTCDVPLFVLGSSLHGAGVAARLGLPYGFASHFAPHAMADAVRLYRSTFRPSKALGRPYVIAGMTVFAAEDEGEARRHYTVARRMRARFLLARDPSLTDAEADALLASPHGRFVDDMLHYSAIGTPRTVRAELEKFAALADADELILVPAAPSIASRVRSVELVGEAFGRGPLRAIPPAV